MAAASTPARRPHSHLHRRNRPLALALVLSLVIILAAASWGATAAFSRRSSKLLLCGAARGRSAVAFASSRGAASSGKTFAGSTLAAAGHRGTSTARFAAGAARNQRTASMSLSSTDTSYDFASFLASIPATLSERIDASEKGKDGPNIHIILGNEAGDADSIVSALGLGYVQSLTQTSSDEGTKDVIVPVGSIPRADLALRPDVTMLLDLAGIDAATLLYLDDETVTKHLLPPQSATSDGLLPRTLTLVDHNRIRASLSHLSHLVVEIVDHHEDEGAHVAVTNDSGKRDVAFEDGHATVASTCTIVVERLLRTVDANNDSAPSMSAIDGRLGLLLLGVILLDSVNMLPAAGRGTPRDAFAIDALLKLTDWASLAASPSLDDAALAAIFPNGAGTAPDRTALFEALGGAKSDPRFWAGLSVPDCLRLDYKKFVVPSSPESSSPRVSSIGLSSVLLTLDALLSRENFREELAAFVASRDVDLFGILTVTFPDGAPQRELLLTGSGAGVVDSFAEYLLSHTDAAFLEVSEREECAESDDGGAGAVRVFRQGNGKGSRKQVAPVLLGHASALSRP